jgi:hypothetical protein
LAALECYCEKIVLDCSAERVVAVETSSTGATILMVRLDLVVSMGSVWLGGICVGFSERFVFSFVMIWMMNSPSMHHELEAQCPRG